MFSKHTVTRLYAIGLLPVLSFFTYTIPNRTTLGEPTLLPLFGIERLIPFVPWTLIIYLSAYFFVGIALLLVPQADFKRAIQGIIIILLIQGLFFIFFTTTYPRSTITVAPMTGTLRQLYDWLITVDTPKNCFPSQHVSTAVFSGLLLYRTYRAKRKPAWSWICLVYALLIVLSTLTIKQHYLLDVLGGIVLGAGVYAGVFYYNSIIRLK